MFRRFSVKMELYCALKAAKHLFKIKAIIIITLMTDLAAFPLYIYIIKVSSTLNNVSTIVGEST